MGKSVAEIYKESFELNENDRAQLAGLLLESVESDPDQDVEQAWVAEIDRRLKSLDDGSATMIPWEEVKRRTHKKIEWSFDRSFLFSRKLSASTMPP